MRLLDDAWGRRNFLKGATLAGAAALTTPATANTTIAATAAERPKARPPGPGRFNYPTPALARIELPVESFIAFLRDAPNDMPAYSASVLSDQNAADIHAYLQSLPGRKPAKDFPLLNQ